MNLLQIFSPPQRLITNMKLFHTVFLALVIVACGQVADSPDPLPTYTEYPTHTPLPTYTQPPTVELPPTATSEPTSTSALVFVPTFTPVPSVHGVRQTIEAGGFERMSTGNANDSFYELIAECGGVIPVRDGIIGTVMPKSNIDMNGDWYIDRDGSTEPLDMQFTGRKPPVKWSIFVIPSGRQAWERIAEGELSGQCEVTLDKTTGPWFD